MEQLFKVNQLNISPSVLVKGFLPLYCTAHNFATSKEIKTIVENLGLILAQPWVLSAGMIL